MRVFAWVDSWQQQCCGDDFRVGSTVQWRVKRYDEPNEWIERLLGSEWASTVTYGEDHHMDESDFDLAGVVQSIQVVTCAREVGRVAGPGPSGPVLRPVPLSGQLRKIDVADKWEPEPGDDATGWSFDGWIVELEVDQRPDQRPDAE